MTAAAIILSQVDRTITPETLNGLLQDGGGFWNGDLIWDEVAEAVPGATWVTRDDWNIPMTEAELEEVRGWRCRADGVGW